ncbi:MAG: DUF2752 domain-containing protein [Chitinophagaceae bacterium]|nr:DUF2752 domain-containing protein [Chitinophagaceae bacterium]
MKHTIIFVLLIAATTTTAVFIYMYPPTNNSYYPPCILKKITGFDCAGCGSARACYQLLHGNAGQAANHNVLLLLFLPVMAIGLLHFFTGKMKAAWQRLNKPMIVLCLVVFFWIIRNIPFFPFEWLHSDK